ncbi:MAG: TrkA C-terminal domain-containing protein, partial [Anaerolineales bacterium]
IDDLDQDSTHIVEVTLAPRSRMVGQSLRGARFRDLYGFTALAVWRGGEVITRRLRDVRLRFGDALLLKGPQYRLPALIQSEDFLVLEPVQLELRRRNRAPHAVGIMALVLG